MKITNKSIMDAYKETHPERCKEKPMRDIKQKKCLHPHVRAGILYCENCNKPAKHPLTMTETMIEMNAKREEIERKTLYFSHL